MIIRVKATEIGDDQIEVSIAIQIARLGVAGMSNSALCRADDAIRANFEALNRAQSHVAGHQQSRLPILVRHPLEMGDGRRTL